jgi:ABC-type sugar transport system ATPase subunit
MLEAIDIQKSYGGVVALSGAHLTVRPGSVHALLGENGAGKSTLIKVLTGAVVPDHGLLRLKGEEVRFAHTDDAARHGVAVVSQELSIFPDLDVLANLFPTRKPRRRGLVDRRAMAREARPVLARLGLYVGLDTPVGQLTIGQQQLVEVARGVLRRPTVLVLDEPTSALDAEDTERLLTMLEALREENVGVLIVSHILEEVRRLADEVTVLRDGHTVMSARPMSELDIPTLVEAMLGERPDTDAAPAAASPAGPGERWDASRSDSSGALVARSVTVPGLLSEVSITARPGEVVGLTGLAGSGHQALLSVLAGRVSPTAGDVVLPDGSTMPRGVLKAIRSGVALVTGDRRRVGLMLDQPVWENVGHVKDIATAPSWRRVRRSSLRARAQGHTSNLGIRPADVDKPTGLLSGGNQQKVVLAKWLEIDPSVLLLDDPTRGVDVGARAEIHRVIRDLTADGRVAVLCSTDLEELAQFCDRVYVLYRGEVAAEISAPAIDSHTLLTLMNGPAPDAHDPPEPIRTAVPTSQESA